MRPRHFLHQSPYRFPQRGITLLEALVGFVLLSLALLGAAHLHTVSRQSSEIARQNTEAIHLAQRSIEALRGDPLPHTSAQAGIAETTTEVPGRTTRYVLRQNLSGTADALLRSADVTVDWTDRSGSPRQIGLHTKVNRLPPMYSAVLSLAPARTPPLGRPLPRPEHGPGPDQPDIDLPPDTRHLGENRGIWKPPGPGEVAYVLDLTTGRIVSRCRVAASADTQSIAAAALQKGCTAFQAVLLQGHVRFSLGALPDPLQANDPPLPFEVELSLDPDTRPRPMCETHSMKTVRQMVDGVLRTRTVAASATPSSMGVNRWQETGERFATYVCVLAPPAGGTGWSGHWALRPDGWTLGTTATDRKICRYGTDLDASGTLDPSSEHPVRYRHVRGPLSQQNHLVVRGDLPCPHGIRRPQHNGNPADTVPPPP
jgi:Tfp pilus assembly protein PilV